MKKFIPLLMAFLTTITAVQESYAELVYFNEDLDGAEATPFRFVETDDTGITVTYNFDVASFEPDDVYDGTYWCRIKGFGQTCEEGTPSLSRRIDIFDLPANITRPSITLVSYEYADFNYSLTPARHDLVDDIDEFYTKSNVKPIERSAFEGENNIVRDFNFTHQKNRSQYEVEIIPVQFDMSLNRTRIYHKIKYRIDYDSSQSTEDVSESEGDSNDTIESYGLGDFTATIDKVRFLTENPKSYLILSCDKYSSAAERLAELKRCYGMNTYVSLRTSWNQTNITDSIAYYLAKDTDIEYVLLLGSYNDIFSPSSATSNGTVTSDLCYALSSGDKFEDCSQRFYIGRIPVRTADEANNVIDKIIGYSLTPPEDEEFYNRGTNLAYFQYKNNNKQEDRGYLQCSEQIRNYLMNMGYDIKRVYTANTSTPYYLKDGSPMPEELLPNNYNWNNNQTNVADAINNGGFYVFHRDHGMTTGWWQPPFEDNDLSLLTNTDRLPVVFSINCLTGKFDENQCFAEKLLKINKQGAAAVIAATQSTFTSSNNTFACGIFNSIFGGTGPLDFISEVPMAIGAKTNVENNELGRMLEVGLYRMKEESSTYYEYHSKAYHVFGDPSMMIWSEYPSHIKIDEYEPVYKTVFYDGLKQRKEFDYFKIALKEEGYAVVYDTLTKTSTLRKGKTGILDNLENGRHRVFLYRPNCLLKELEIPANSSSGIIIEETPFRIIPNPASSYCYIEYWMNNGETAGIISITSVSTGNHVGTYQLNANRGEIELDVVNLPNGEYIVTMGIGSGDIVKMAGTQKLIVKH